MCHTISKWNQHLGLSRPMLTSNVAILTRIFSVGCVCRSKGKPGLVMQARAENRDNTAAYQALKLVCISIEFC